MEATLFLSHESTTRQSRSKQHTLAPCDEIITSTSVGLKLRGFHWLSNASTLSLTHPAFCWHIRNRQEQQRENEYIHCLDLPSPKRCCSVEQENEGTWSIRRHAACETVQWNQSPSQNILYNAEQTRQMIRFHLPCASVSLRESTLMIEKSSKSPHWKGSP